MIRYRRGELYYYDLRPTVGSEQDGIRPVLVIQNDVGNFYSPTLIVAAITSSKPPSLPTHVALVDVPELESGSMALLEQLRTIDKRRVREYIGRVSQPVMRQVDKALLVSLGMMSKALQEAMVMALCGVCAHHFYNMPGYHVRRIDRDQAEKDICTYCGARQGFDYEIRRTNS